MEHSVPKISSESSLHLITGDKEMGLSWTTHVQQAGNTALSEGRAVDCQGQENPLNTLATHMMAWLFRQHKTQQQASDRFRHIHSQRAAENLSRSAHMHIHVKF